MDGEWESYLRVACLHSFFVANIAIVVLGAISHSGYNSNGIADLKLGDAATISRWNTALHVLINALSTMLLAGSNYTMQVLGSPTRQDIDAAHARGQWLDIGLLSARNLRSISRKRAALWVILALSSIPLHLFYNASIFKVVASHSYAIIVLDVASDDWKEINSSTDTDTYSGGVYSPLYAYSKLSNDQWSKMYNDDPKYVSGRGDLYLGFDRVAFIFDCVTYGPSETFRNMTCQEFESLSRTDFGFDLAVAPQLLSDWIEHKILLQAVPVMLHVVYAMSQRRDDPDRIQFSLYFMAVVIVFNFLKLITMACVLVTDRSAYLVTLGDAAASFLERVDSATTKKCMLGREEMLLSMGHSPSLPIPSIEEKENLTLRVEGMWLPRSRNFFFSVHRSGKVSYTMLVLGIVIIFVLWPLYVREGVVNGPGITTYHSWSWGSLSNDYLSVGSSSISATSTLWNAWLANAPQLLLSICYLAINTICTSMAGAQEWNNLSIYRKGLRVTKPLGKPTQYLFLATPV